MVFSGYKIDVFNRTELYMRHRGYMLLSTARDIEAQCIREIQTKPTDVPQTYIAFESPGYLGIGGKVWDSTFVLLKYLQSNPYLIQDKNIIEFGSGTGLAGYSKIMYNYSWCSV